MPMRKTSLALASIVGAFTFFIALPPAGRAKGVSRSASSAAYSFSRGTATCVSPEFKKHVLIQLVARHDASVLEMTAALKAGFQLMAINVPICISASTGFFDAVMKTNEPPQLQGWVAGTGLLWAIANRNRGVLASMTRMSSLPSADLSPSQSEDCIEEWASTSCSLGKAAADCIISEVDTLLTPENAGKFPGGSRCMIRIGGDCEVVVMNEENKKLGVGDALNDEQMKSYAKLISAQSCGVSAGSTGTAELARLVLTECVP